MLRLGLVTGATVSSLAVCSLASRARPIRCEAQPAIDRQASKLAAEAGIQPQQKTAGNSTAVRQVNFTIDPHQLTTGSMLGLALGFGLRRVGSILVGILSGCAATLYFLERAHIISVPWRRVQRAVLNRDTVRDYSESLRTILLKDLSFNSAFAAAFYVGLVYGK